MTGELTSPDKRTLLAQDDDLGAHRLACLLNGQAAFFIHVDDGHSGVHASSFHYSSDDSPSYHCQSGINKPQCQKSHFKNMHV